MSKISIVIPIYNAEKYLAKCLDSVVGQTLKDIEIICVNDGSTDSSLEIAEKYAYSDGRIKIINKSNSGYGNSMNMGFDIATGEYLGIVESDDYAEPDMFEKLYSEAEKHKLDIVKSGFYYYYSVPKESNISAPVLTKGMPHGVFCPTEKLSLKKQISVFNFKPTIWSAIYRNDFIKENHIRFNETAGASYQDLAFTFKVFALAKRVKFIPSCLLHYRQDNESSSINSKNKTYCVCDEYAEISRFIRTIGGNENLEIIRNRMMFDTYVWNYNRLSEPLASEFIFTASEDLKKDMEIGFCKRSAYPWYKWDTLLSIINAPKEYHEERVLAKIGQKPQGKKQNVFASGFRCLCENGFSYTVKLFFEKFKGRFSK